MKFNLAIVLTGVGFGLAKAIFSDLNSYVASCDAAGKILPFNWGIALTKWLHDAVTLGGIALGLGQIPGIPGQNL